MFDQPAVIDYILAKTNASKLYYVGFSQGTTSLLVMLSQRPEYNNKIYAASLMAPVGYIYYADSIYKLFTSVIPMLKVTIRKQSASSTGNVFKFTFLRLWKIMNFYHEIKCWTASFSRCAHPIRSCVTRSLTFSLDRAKIKRMMYVKFGCSFTFNLFD